MQPIITLKNISKTFLEKTHHPLTVVRDINLEIFPSEFFIFLGPSGCGKSTLLRLMSGLEKEYRGTIAFDRGIGQQHTSFVFQQFALLPWLTVAENIGLGLTARHVASSTWIQRVHQELKRFHLERFAHAYPRELSGGMRQRTGIARALATDPKIIFMDEPFSELDSFTAQELRQELLDIWEEQKPTIVMVTHNIQEALELGDRIAVITARPGTVAKIIENTLPRPRQKRSEKFFTLEDHIASMITHSEMK